MYTLEQLKEQLQNMKQEQLLLIYEKDQISNDQFEVFISPNKIAHSFSEDAKTEMKFAFLKDVLKDINSKSRSIDLLSLQIKELSFIDNPLRELFDTFNTAENEK